MTPTRNSTQSCSFSHVQVGKLQKNPKDVRCHHFPPRVFLSRGHVTGEPRKQAATENSHACKQRRGTQAIMHAFMHALMHLRQCESKRTLLTQPWTYAARAAYCGSMDRHAHEPASPPPHPPHPPHTHTPLCKCGHVHK